MLVVAALLVAGSGPDGDNGAVLVGKNVVAINLPPLVAFGRAPQVVRSIVHLVSAIPVLLPYAGARLPLIVLAISVVVFAILRLRLVVVILVRMVLRERGQASEGRCQDWECNHSDHSIHSSSLILRFL